MRNVWAIAKKELNVYFATPLAYVMFAGFIVIASIFFQALVGQYEDVSMFYMRFNQPEIMQRLNFTDMVMRYLFGNLAVILIFIVPFLTMRLIAEEKKQKTMDLLLTCPVRPSEILFGKYFAALGLIIFALALTVMYPVLLTLAAGGGEEIGLSAFYKPFAAFVWWAHVPWYLGFAAILGLGARSALAAPAGLAWRRWLGTGAAFAGWLLLGAIVWLCASKTGVEWQTMGTAYLGLFLLGAAYMTLGLFFSSLTESQVIAALLTFVTLLLLWVVGWLSGRVEGDMREVLTYLSAPQHLDSFTKGVLEVKDIVYYLSFIVLGLFLTQGAIERHRWA
jgi:ABC-type transport system involved in multi-copper enzyme maturation permease subunit